jgi:ATP-dependent helicase HrpB
LIQKNELPIDPFLPQIVETVRTAPLVLVEAEPGAGKTTRLPAALLAAGMQDIVVLEPRRLAVRMAARRVAEEWSEDLGARVGYQVRFEGVSSDSTRLWYVTEGILTRRLLSDPLLSGVQVVVLDEFHERHIETDLALAMLRNLLPKRKDLRIVIMSATLSGAGLTERLGFPPVFKIPGRNFPVSTKYVTPGSAPLEGQVSGAVESALSATDGHVLVFLPGAVEIRRSLIACEGLARRAGCGLFPLFGELSPGEQDAAVGQSRTRKIICSTNVAESSITIANVQAVVDSGLARILSHSPWSGLSRLHIQKISKASAIQRAGRAGRTGPGMAIRLYPEADFVRRPDHTPPEIVRSELSGVMLQVLSMGVCWGDLPWLDEPSTEMLDAARDLLLRLRMIDANGRVTEDGRKLSRLPTHPRLARLVLEAARLGWRNEGAELAARLSEMNFRPSEGTTNRFASDIDAILHDESSFAVKSLTRQILKNIREPLPQVDENGLEKAVLTAYSDRVARKRGETLLLSNGSVARLDRQSVVSGEFLVAIESDDRSGQQIPAVRIASPIKPDWLLDLFPDHITAGEELVWNREGERVEQVNVLRYDSLVIDESRSAPTDLLAASRLLASKALEKGFESFADAKDLDGFLRRLRFASEHSPQISFDSGIATTALAALSEGITSFAELRKRSSNGGLLSTMQLYLPMRLVDEIAPTHVVLPGGRRARIEYHEGRPPSVSSRLQDFFGMRESPRVARGKVPLVVHLLAPNQRPVQVTSDLVSFWKDLYPQVRRELSRRYPRHSWPESPA